MSEKLLNWIRLQTALGVGSRCVNQIIDRGIDPGELFELKENELRMTGIFKETEISRILNSNIERAKNIFSESVNKGCEIFIPTDEKFPKRLLTISSVPCVLYVKGTLPEIDNEVLIAIVGTRDYSAYGKKTTEEISSKLAVAGAIVVSGGAIGVDTFAHTAAMKSGGKTIAVLGCGVDYPYPRTNSDMRKLIVKNGALVSEYPPGTQPKPFNFPMRNRLISGLSLGTLVVEAGEKSGSLITANHASEQGRDVFAIPGNILAPSFQGSNKLLREGAKPVFSAQDILEEYESRFPEKIKMSGMNEPLTFNEFATDPSGDLLTESSQTEKKKKASPKREKNKENKPQKTDTEERQDISEMPAAPPAGLDAEQAEIFKIINKQEMTIDEITEKTDIPFSKLLTLLTRMEIKGYIKALPGNKYSLK